MSNFLIENIISVICILILLNWVVCHLYIRLKLNNILVKKSAELDGQIYKIKVDINYLKSICESSQEQHSRFKSELVEFKIQKLVDIGFPREVAVEAILKNESDIAKFKLI
ncbi:hypothetical protein [Aliikangiella sp. IMCC44359]|uniref:hypothetical protein n=1 Tax=Aliikangiella sp. IMCC44359 TaxID=3459125 RepID=UPI00403B0136